MPSLHASPMTYIQGSDFSRYIMQGEGDFAGAIALLIKPHVVCDAWQIFDLDVHARDTRGKDADGRDKTVIDIVDSGLATRVIYKEPTITTTEQQAEEMGLKNGKQTSPNNDLRNAWNLFAIRRDLIRFEHTELGIGGPVSTHRAAQGGGYQSRYAIAEQAGEVRTVFTPEGGGEPVEMARLQVGPKTSVSTVPTPLIPFTHMVEEFFADAWRKKLRPIMVLKDTAIAEHGEFREIAEGIFADPAKGEGGKSWEQCFNEAGLLDWFDGRLGHQLTDAMTMSAIRWKKGGYAICGPNAEMDMIQDEITQLHGSPALMDSVSTGMGADGQLIRMFDAAHGTDPANNRKRLAGEQTSFNALGMLVGLLGALDFAAECDAAEKAASMRVFTDRVRAAIKEAVRAGEGTPDMGGVADSEGFIHAIARRI